MEGLVRNKQSAGGLAYGYRANPEKKGQFIPVPNQVAIVREIFERYVAGESPRGIAHDLNRRLVPPPRRGSKWNASTINGYAARGSGILHNQLYVGKYVWNKNRMVKDPDGPGTRISRPNPEAMHHVTELPELRIISDDLFEAAQRTVRKHQVDTENPNKSRRPKKLLSGLLKCGACGSGMTASGHDKTGKQRLVCSAHKESRSCPDPQSFYLAHVERKVLDMLFHELEQPEALAAYVAEFQAEKKRLADLSVDQRSRLERAIAAAKREVARLVEMVQKGFAEAEDLMEEMKAAKAARDKAQAELADLEPVDNVLVLHPAALKKYAEQIKLLRDQAGASLTQESQDAAQWIRSLISKVIVRRDPEKRGEPAVEIEGDLALLLTRKGMEKKTILSMVAEEGFKFNNRRALVTFDRTVSG
jgi:site-specific DNA recombinase